MTVEELIAKLQTMPPKHKAVVDLHSEYTEVSSVGLIIGVENGGYISRRYQDTPGQHRACGYVHIGYREDV